MAAPCPVARRRPSGVKATRLDRPGNGISRRSLPVRVSIFRRRPPGPGEEPHDVEGLIGDVRPVPRCDLFDPKTTEVGKRGNRREIVVDMRHSSSPGPCDVCATLGAC